MRNLLYAASALAAIALAPAANANLIADYSAGSGFTTICTSGGIGGSCSPGGTFVTSNGLDFIFYGVTSNSPGTISKADVLQATVQLTNPTATAQSIVLRVGDTDFTAPAGNVVFSNNISGTVVTGGLANVFDSTACVNPTNLQSSCAGGSTTPVIFAAITAPGSGSNSNSLLVNLTGPYSMTEFLNITLSPGANINFSASADVTPVSEPTSLALLGVGLLGLGALARRKRAQSSLLT